MTRRFCLEFSRDEGDLSPPKTGYVHAWWRQIGRAARLLLFARIVDLGLFVVSLGHYWRGPTPSRCLPCTIVQVWRSVPQLSLTRVREKTSSFLSL